MNRLPIVFLGILLSAIALNSCQKELSDPGATTSPIVSGDFRAKIQGIQWVALVSGASRQNGLISLFGNASGKTIVMTLQDSGVHHYTLDPTTPQAGALTDSSGNIIAFTTNGGATAAQSGGSVDITSIDTANKKMSGTFRFMVYRPIDSASRTITEGSFTNIAYATTLPPPASTDTFRVKIDGVDFIPASIIGLHVTITNQITISGTDQTGVKSVNILIPDNVTPGTYPMTTIGGTYSGLYNKDAATILSSDIGSLTILTHNPTTKRIRGNFNFHATQFIGTAQAILSAGFFAVTYQ